MSRDAYIQRENERDWQDDVWEKVAAQERRDRMLEKGSVSPQEARRAIAALEPDSSPASPLRRLGGVLWWVGFIALAWILALACAVALLDVVAWFMDGP